METLPVTNPAILISVQAIEKRELDVYGNLKTGAASLSKLSGAPGPDLETLDAAALNVLRPPRK